MTRAAIIFALVLPWLVGCGEEGEATTERCGTCGMIVAPESGWRAGGATSEGEALAFDAPKCLFRYGIEHGHVEGAWVIEYYSQERRPPEGLFYVIGSDLESPMGRDLVPVEGEEAANRLLRDHHGEAALRFDQVTEAIVTALFTPRS